MAVELRIPMLSMGMTEAVLSEWLVTDGAAVQEGDPVYSVESDKTIQEIEAPAAGVVRIKGEVGETYPVGELVGTIE